jgi:hypothetical protein
MPLQLMYAHMLHCLQQLCQHRLVQVLLLLHVVIEVLLSASVA